VVIQLHVTFRMEGSMTSVDIDIVEFKNADGHKIGQNM
jgi:hypothetical protein